VRELCEKAKRKQGEEARWFLVEHNKHFALLNESLMQELLALDALEKTEARKRAVEAIQGLLAQLESVKTKLIRSLPSSSYYVNTDGTCHTNTDEHKG